MVQRTQCTTASSSPFSHSTENTLLLYLQYGTIINTWSSLHWGKTNRNTLFIGTKCIFGGKPSTCSSNMFKTPLHSSSIYLLQPRPAHLAVQPALPLPCTTRSNIPLALGLHCSLSSHFNKTTLKTEMFCYLHTLIILHISMRAPELFQK